MNAWRTGLLLLLLLTSRSTIAAPAAGAVAPVAGSEPLYSLKIAANLRTLEARVCFAGTPPARLVLANMAAARRLRGAAIERGGQMYPVRLTAQGLVLANARADDCLKYVMGLAVPSPPSTRGPATADRTVLTTAADWLWYDAATKAGAALRLQFDLPPEVRVSVPWSIVPTTDANSRAATYRVRLPLVDWPDQVAIGALQQWQIRVPGAQPQISLLAAPDAGAIPHAALLQRSLVGPWLEEAAAITATIHGRFPAAAPEVLVVATAATPRVVRTTRIFDGGRRTVFLAIDPRHSLPEFRADPTAIATFARLLLPPLQPEAQWLAEGLALYYQDVARVRYGTLSIPEAWVRLQSGMLRPHPSPASPPGPRAAPDPWRGALLWLQIDALLREESRGSQSLDGALRQLGHCCLAGDRRWSLVDLSRQLQRLSGTAVFGKLESGTANAADQSRQDEEFFDDLGVRIHGDELEIDDAAPLACVRETIMQSQRLKQCVVKEVPR